MQQMMIQEKLAELGVDVGSIVLGDFDYIGRFTAERQRQQNDPNYKTCGAFYRSNYERGILIYHLIKSLNAKSMLEIGFGRGYSTFCAAKAFCDMGIEGTVTTVDPNLSEEYLKMLMQVFPKKWFERIKFLQGTSAEAIPKLENDERFDLVYIDGDHSYAATKLDWELTKDRYDKCLLFDDYHLPSKKDPGIECREFIDTIDDPTKQLIIMDRRIFQDDRHIIDQDVNYGQVLITKSAACAERHENEW